MILGITASQRNKFVGLLDDYPNAAAAYSLRKLRTSYTGSAIRVRRSNDNAEQDIGFDGSGNLDTSSLSTFVGANNGFVTTWYDQSGNSNDATQSTAASQPKVFDSSTGVVVENSNPTMTFDGANNFFSFSALPITQPITISSVYKATANNSVVVGASANCLVYGRRGSGEYIMFAGVALAGGTHPSTQQYSFSLFDGASSQGWWNGVNILSGNVGSFFSIEYIGANRGAALDKFTGNIQEIVIYNTDESSNRTGIETNINDYYAIY